MIADLSAAESGFCPLPAATMINPEDYLRPLVIALITTPITWALGRIVDRWLPRSVDGKDADELLHDNRRLIRVANASILLGIATGLAMYTMIGFSEHDIRPIGLATGIALSGPLTVLRVGSALQGRQFAQVAAAYAIHQKLPLGALYALAGLGTAMLVLTALSLSAGSVRG